MVVLKSAFASALAQYEETMGEAFPVTPKIKAVEDTAFWAEVAWVRDELTVSVTIGLIKATLALWERALADPAFTGNECVTAGEMTHLSLVWLVLHELHHFQMGHFTICARHHLTETKEPNSFGVVVLSSQAIPPALSGIPADDLHKVEPCLELQADHDAVEMLIDAYSPDAWDVIRMRAAAISGMMMLIEREDNRHGHTLSSHPKAATRAFQLLAHVVQMPMIEALIAANDPHVSFEPRIPPDEERAAFDRDVVIPCFFDAVKLAELAAASTIAEDLGAAEAFFQDVEIALLADPARFGDLVTTGARQWSELVRFNTVLLESLNLSIGGEPVTR